MTVDWNGYSPWQPPVTGQPLRLMSRREAKLVYSERIAAASSRIEELRHLLIANGINLESGDEGLQQLNDWFRTNVEPADSSTERLRSMWYAVVNDIGLFLGQVIQERAPNLKWAFIEKPPSHLSFQRHAIVGFTRVPNRQFTLDIDNAVATYGHRVISGASVPQDAFVRWVDDAVGKA